MWEIFFSAVALFLVFEGILPFLSPEKWRNTLKRMLEFNDRTLRLIGLISMSSGVLVLYIVHGIDWLA